ncbi:hypothetical protein HW555_000669, partial [Spodoptera exigua]
SQMLGAITAYRYCQENTLIKYAAWDEPQIVDDVSQLTVVQKMVGSAESWDAVVFLCERLR